MGNYLYLYRSFYFLVDSGFAPGISVKVSIEFPDLAYFSSIDYFVYLSYFLTDYLVSFYLAYFSSINYFVYLSYFLTDYLVSFYLLIVDHIENKFLLCDLSSDRFDILLVLLVLSVSYLLKIFSRTLTVESPKYKKQPNLDQKHHTSTENKS